MAVEPATVDQQIYLELKNITQVLVSIAKALGQISISIEKNAMRKP
jgi:hypothetical protein